MRRLVFIALILLVLLIVGCTDKKERLVEVNINSLTIPQDFNYEMARVVSLDIQGAYRLPLTLTTTGGNVLFRSYMNPQTGIVTRLSLPQPVKRVVAHYQGREVTLSVTNNTIAYDFKAPW